MAMVASRQANIVPIKEFQKTFNPNAFKINVEGFKDVGRGLNIVAGNKIAEEYGSKFISLKKVNSNWKRLSDTSYQINADEVTAVRTEITKVLRWALKTPKFITTRQIGKGMLKYEYHAWNAVQHPRYSLDFARGKNVAVSKEGSTQNMLGFDYDFHVTMPQIDQASISGKKVMFNETLLQGTIRNLTESLAIYSEYSKMLGSDIPNMIDIGVKGLLNNASVTDPGALGEGSDDDLTAAGDVYHSAIVEANKLIVAKFDPPFDLMMSPGVYAQALKNKEGTPNVSDLELIFNLGVKEGNRMFRNIIINPFMIDSETETNSTGAMACIASGEQNFEIVETYPLGFYPLPPQDLGLDGKILWCGGSIVYRPAAVVFANTLTINTLSA